MPYESGAFFYIFMHQNLTTMRILQLFVILLISNFCLAQKEPLIPMPKNIEYQSDFFALNAKTVIEVEDVKSFEALFLKENIKAKTGLDLSVTSKTT